MSPRKNRARQTPVGRTTEARARTAPPRGLVAAFTLINQGGATPIAGSAAASRAYGPARQIIDLLQGAPPTGIDQGLVIERIITRATQANNEQTYTSDDIAVIPELMADTALNIGFAMCWLLMMSVNGKGGAR